jgi:hypothetical protein
MVENVLVKLKAEAGTDAILVALAVLTAVLVSMPKLVIAATDRTAARLLRRLMVN